MSKLQTTYDGTQHCTTVREDLRKSVAAGAGPSHGGTGDALSPLDLVGGGLATCMLMTMGMLALKEKLDITGTRVDIAISMAKEPVWRIGAIELTFHMPKNLPADSRLKLERAADACPIKHSLHPDMTVTAGFVYPD